MANLRQVHLNFTFVVTCETLNLENGNVSYNESLIPNKGYHVGTMASFTCNSGYCLTGLELSICQSFGHWCWGPPICKQCKKIISINFAFICIPLYSVVSHIDSYFMLFINTLRNINRI